ncbi:MAG: M23 family metallopeptidase [Deferribacterales bacterium]
MSRFIFLCLTVFIASYGFAGQKNMKMRVPAEEVDTTEIFSTGIIPGFYNNADCTGISSLFASPTRYDGSRRPNFRNNGLHGGLDLSLEPGTPLLAFASGTVISKGMGGMMTGIFIWTIHTPEDTGLPFYLFSKYQHLSEEANISVGDRVKTGDVIGFSGKTGTEGGYYGSRGYPHLHWTIFAAASDEYKVKGDKVMTKGYLVDPLIVYIKGLNSVEQSIHPEESQKNPEIPYEIENGALYPADAKFVWPVRCK